MPQNVQKVVFAVPTYAEEPCVDFSISALRTNKLLIERGIATVWRYGGLDPYVQKARNKLASEFITDHKDATDFFFIDDDVGWEAEAVLRMLQRPEDIIVGIYPKKNDITEWPVELLFDNDSSPPVPIVQEGLCLAAHAPTGFMRLKRHVLEKAAEESGIYPEHDLVKGTMQCWDIFRTGFVPSSEGSRTGRWWGEDFFFCAMARHMGMDIWVDPDISFTHRGKKSWRGRFRNAIEERIDELTGRRKYTQDTPAIRRWGEPSELGDLAARAFDKALEGIHSLPERILRLDGMVGRRYRMFLNNLMLEIGRAEYLEIGCYKGASTLAAAYRSGAGITCVDNWSLFGGTRDEFVKNMAEWNSDYRLYDADFWHFDFFQLQPHNVYMFDGPHSEKDHYAAMCVALPALTNEYVLIVDDWNWETTHSGTMAGLRDSGQQIVSAIEVRTIRGDVAPLDAQNSDWSNGCLIAVIRKTA